MDLLCCESAVQSVAKKDPVLLLDDRVFKTMLKTEIRCVPRGDYMVAIQKGNLTPQLRKIVVDWMWEVCEDQKCQEDIFPLAVSYLDRFLSVNVVDKNQLQLLGCTCLLISSKLRQSDCFTVDLLIVYSDNSITAEELYMWEMLLLSVLKWDVSTITAHDFLWYILKRLNIDTSEAVVEVVFKHSGTFIGMCAKDYKFCAYHPSMIAGAAVIAALNGLEYAAIYKYDLFTKVNAITGADKELLKVCQEEIEGLVDHQKRKRKQLEFALLQAEFDSQDHKTDDEDCWLR